MMVWKGKAFCNGFSFWYISSFHEGLSASVLLIVLFFFFSFFLLHLGGMVPGMHLLVSPQESE